MQYVMHYICIINGSIVLMSIICGENLGPLSNNSISVSINVVSLKLIVLLLKFLEVDSCVGYCFLITLGDFVIDSKIFYMK